MSGSETVTNADRFDLQMSTSMNAAMSALAAYEFLITIDQVVSCVLQRKKSVATFLLLVTRWSMLLQAITILIPTQKLATCVAMQRLSGGSTLLLCFISAVFSGLRVYALGGRSVRLFLMVFLLLLPPVGINMYGYIHASIVVDPFSGCELIWGVGDKTFTALVRAARIPAIIGDVLVILITWIKSFRQVLAAGQLGMHMSAHTLLFRDGTIYFLILFIIYTLELCPISAESAVFLSYITGGLPQILIHRFMLNLRQLSDSNPSDTNRMRTLSTPIFNFSFNVDVVGNMSESLEHGPVEDADGGSEENNIAAEVEVEAL